MLGVLRVAPSRTARLLTATAKVLSSILMVAIDLPVASGLTSATEPMTAPVLSLTGWPAATGAAAAAAAGAGAGVVAAAGS
jgi:hypothetical protein